MVNRRRFVWMTPFTNPAKYLSCLWRGSCSDLPASWPCSWHSGWPPLKHEAILWLPSSKHPICFFFYRYIFSGIYESNSCLPPPQMIWTDLYVGPGDGQDGAWAPGCSADGAQWAVGVDWLHGYHRMTREEGSKVSLAVKGKNNNPFLNKSLLPINSKTLPPVLKVLEQICVRMQKLISQNQYLCWLILIKSKISRPPQIKLSEVIYLAIKISIFLSDVAKRMYS